MTDQKSDDEIKEPEALTPNQDDDLGEPKSVVSSADGTQRDADIGDMNIPKYNPHGANSEEPAPSEATANPLELDIPQAEAPETPETVATNETVAEPAAAAENVFGEMSGEDVPTPEATAQEIASEIESSTEPAAETASSPEAVMTGDANPQTDASESTALAEGDERRRYSVEELQHILEEHDLWLSTSGQQGKRANFRHANLQYVILSGCALTEASFRGADLSFADLSQADMANADLSEAMLQQTSFASANLSGASFMRADMRSANLEGANCETADFTESHLIGANLAHLNLTATKFEGANLQSASLAGSNLEGASLRSANAAMANLSQANLNSAYCRETNFEQAILDNASVAEASFRDANLNHASLVGVDLSTATEISQEYQQGLLDAERSQIEQNREALKQEEARIKEMERAIEQRETNVQMEKHKADRLHREATVARESLDRVLSSASEVMRQHHTHDRMFRYIGAMWFMVAMLIATGILLFINALEINQLNTLELAIVVFGCGLIMFLAVMTLHRSIKLSNNLKKLLSTYEKGFGSVSEPPKQN